MVSLPRVFAVLFLLGLAAGTTVWAAAAPKPRELSYNEHIQPILAENCFHCHGPDSGTRKGKLRLDRAADATQPRGDREAAIKPGNVKESPVIERILSTDSEEQMPPPESHKKLKPEEIALLQRWIGEGAKYEEHWSLIAPQRPKVPDLPRGFPAAWSKNPIDRFLAETLAASGLQPNREEESARLLRRVTLDLTGLPPTPEELKAFAADRSADAYERVVDRLLATDASAEHFARYWLDAVRYADTHGIHIDNYRSIWPYRDWVVNAYRRNLPFDQFTIEQVAGDLLPDATLEQKVASGFNRCLPTTSEGGAIAEEYEAIYAKDRVETLSTVWLGLTTGCASCHDHKFDPVSQKDFYSLAAFFRNNTMPAMDGNRHDTPPTLIVPAEGDRDAWTKLQAGIGAHREELQARSKAVDTEFEAWLATAKSLAVPPIDRTVRLHRALVEMAAGQPEAREGPFGLAPKLNDLDVVLGSPVPWLREAAESFSVFVRVEQAPSGTLLSCLDAEAKTAGWALFLENGKLGLHVADDKGAVKVRNVAGAALAPGKWHHVMLTFDTASIRSRTIEVFLDGRQVVNSGVSAHLPADIRPTAPLRLGSRQGTGGQAADRLAGGGVWVQEFRRFDRGFFAADAKEIADLLVAFEGLGAAPEKRTPAQKKQLREHFLAAIDRPSLAVAAKLDRLLAQEDTMRARGGLTLVMEEKKDSEPFAHILNRGEYSQPGEKVGAAVPEVLPPLPADGPRNRLGLARWLVAPSNPLTARVTVNRAWQQVFGTGLVESAGDFGVMGARPSHPKLLDWLAVDFRESGWDYRRLMRQLVTTAAYRQSAVVKPELLERDPDNRLLARGPRYRLDAEQLRDQALAASGLLVARLGGRPVRPYQPEGIWEEVAMKESTTRFYRPDVGENLYRRSLYTIWKRTAAPPAMELLNAPSREVACVRRDRTNTPLQALVTMNEPLFVEASRQLASRVLREAPRFDARLDAVSLRLLGRTFARAERAVLRRTHDDALVVYQRDPALARQLLGVGESPVDPKLPVPELAAWTLVASQVMNLDEALTK
jgi:mono/diheme cytochrome c family protein